MDETTAAVLYPERGKTRTGYLRAKLRNDQGWGGPFPPGCRLPLPHGRIGDYADENFDGTIQIDACAGYSLLPKPGRGRAAGLWCWRSTGPTAAES